MVLFAGAIGNLVCCTTAWQQLLSVTAYCPNPHTHTPDPPLPLAFSHGWIFKFKCFFLFITYFNTPDIENTIKLSFRIP